MPSADQWIAANDMFGFYGRFVYTGGFVIYIAIPAIRSDYTSFKGRLGVCAGVFTITASLWVLLHGIPMAVAWLLKELAQLKVVRRFVDASLGMEAEELARTLASSFELFMAFACLALAIKFALFPRRTKAVKEMAAELPAERFERGESEMMDSAA